MVMDRRHKIVAPQPRVAGDAGRCFQNTTAGNAGKTGARGGEGRHSHRPPCSRCDHRMGDGKQGCRARPSKHKGGQRRRVGWRDMVSHTTIAVIWVAFFQECQRSLCQRLSCGQASGRRVEQVICAGQDESDLEFLAGRSANSGESFGVGTCAAAREPGGTIAAQRSATARILPVRCGCWRGGARQRTWLGEKAAYLVATSRDQTGDGHC